MLATDPAGNKDPTAATHSWKVTPPKQRVEQPPTKTNISGTLIISTIGQPKEITVSESEPNDDIVRANFLGPLTTEIDYRITGNVTPDDKQDLFFFTEAVTQRVTVTLTHEPDNDFDLQVWEVFPDGRYEVLGKSTKDTSPEVVQYNTPPGNHTTVIVVTPWKGSGDYELTVTSEPPTQSVNEVISSSTTTERRTAFFVAGEDHPPKAKEYIWDVTNFDAVPGEVLVKIRTSDNGARSLSTNNNVSLLGMTQCGEVTGAAILFCDNTASGGIRSLSSSDSTEDRDEALRRTMARILRLRADPRIEEATPNYMLYMNSVTPNDTHYPLQWHYTMIGLPSAWEITTGRENVIVAVLDTGIVDHPDLSGQLVTGYDFVSSLNRSGDGDGIDPDPTEPVAKYSKQKNSWHGTHVAGTVGAATNNGIGVAGVSWKSKIMPVRVLDVSGSGTMADVLNGLKYAAGLPNASSTIPDRRADIINLSLGREGASALEQEVYDQVRAQGVLVIAAAGNDGSRCPNYPASYETVLSVSAVNMEQKLASYSNYGPMIDITAPGGNESVDRNGDGYPDGIMSTLIEVSGEYGYDFYSGTSMAAPHVAGVAALLKSQTPDLTVNQLENILLSSATDLGRAERDDMYGHGLLNAGAAVQMASGIVTTPSLTLSPSNLSFGIDRSQMELSLMSSSLADRGVSILEIQTTDNNSWLSAQLTPTYITPLVVEIDRSDLAPRRYAGRITLGTDLGDYEIEVTMEVRADLGASDVGSVALHLIDAKSGEVMKKTETDQSKDYRYLFSDVPQGRYKLIAGTDADGDDELCELNDFCGAYMTLIDPSVIEISNNNSALGNLDFPLTYQGTGVPNPNSLPNNTQTETLKLLLGSWKFSPNIGITFTQRYFMNSIEMLDDDPFVVGTDLAGNLLVADVLNPPIRGYNYTLLALGRKWDHFYLFNLSGDTVNGEYMTVISDTTEIRGGPFPMSGVRVSNSSKIKQPSNRAEKSKEISQVALENLINGYVASKRELSESERVSVKHALKRLNAGLHTKQ